jgi:hypothetical protein
MFEFRLRILDAREGDGDPPSFLGIVEGVPQILVHGDSVEGAEITLQNALVEHLRGLMDHAATGIFIDDLPTVRVSALRWSQPTG